MKHLAIVALATVLTGCVHAMPPAEMAAKVKVCKDNGLQPEEMVNLLYGGIPTDVICTLPEKHTKGDEK